jgi:hypothetical protein
LHWPWATRFPLPAGSSSLDLVSVLGAVELVLGVGVVPVESLLEAGAELVDPAPVLPLGLLGVPHLLGVLLVIADDQLHDVHVGEADVLEELGVVLVLGQHRDPVPHLVLDLLVGEALDQGVDALRSARVLGVEEGWLQVPRVDGDVL